MRGAWTIAWRDFRAALDSPTTHVFVAAFLLVSGAIFAHFLLRYSDLSDALRERAAGDPSVFEHLSLEDLVVRPTLYALTFLLIVLVPLLTMRLLAEEKRAGTYELLLTAPVSPGALVAGKLLGGLLLVLLPLVLTLWYPLVLVVVATPDPAPLLAGYLGLLLIAAAFTSVGLLTSSLTDSPGLAGFLCFVALLMSMFAGFFAEMSETNLAVVLGQLSLTRHYGSFVRGVIDSGDVVFLATFTVAIGFVTQRVLESRRWR